MKTNALIATALLVGLASPASADGRKPGSVLIYPVHRSGTLFWKAPNGEIDGLGPATVYFTIVSVTNTNPSPTSGSTDIHFEYVNVIPQPSQPFKPLDCTVIDRIEALTPADTRSVLTHCQNPGFFNEGYLVISALDPSAFKTRWSHDYLVGSEIIVNGAGSIYALNAIPFDSPQPKGSATDIDGDEQLDFDGVEYEAIPDELYIDVFSPVMKPSLALINLTGGVNFEAVVGFSIWNDNEFALSATLAFRCWFDEPLEKISLIFTDHFLRFNTPQDPTETDFDCDSIGDVESGWARIRGIVANSQAESIQDPALLGAATAPEKPSLSLGAGRLLWESYTVQTNGDFLKFGVDDPEH